MIIHVKKRTVDDYIKIFRDDSQIIINDGDDIIFYGDKKSLLESGRYNSIKDRYCGKTYTIENCFTINLEEENKS